jgi:7-cyano-7-deazaguanine synthase
MDVVVLASGGLDSTACLEYYVSRKFDVVAIHVDYNQASRVRERVAVEAICGALSVPLSVIGVSGVGPFGGGEIRGRNAMLITLALVSANVPRSALMALGIHAGTRYPDCAPVFVSAMQGVADIYANGAIRIDAPFLYRRKIDVVRTVRRELLAITYSCELGNAQPCGNCSSCRDREALTC